MLYPGAIILNRYRIIRLLGQGGFGAVYQAEDLRLGQMIALKENIGGDPTQFQQEAALLARLQHPNLPGVSDYFVESNGVQYLVMDYIEGEDLDTRLYQQGALSESEALVWIAQILDAVGYLHTRGIIHRDIKPSNIKIMPNGRAVLVDFGIAKVYQFGRPTISGAARMGTLGYASPEHHQGGTDQRSDVYSLGATLYSLLTGRTPPDAFALVGGSAMLVPPQNLNPGLSAQTNQAILRAMALDPESRFQSAEEMQQALIPPLPPTIPAPQYAPQTLAPITRLPNKNWLLVASLALFGILFILLVGFLAYDRMNSLASRTASAVTLVETDTPAAPQASTTPVEFAVVGAPTLASTSTPTLRSAIQTPTPSPTARSTATTSATAITNATPQKRLDPSYTRARIADIAMDFDYVSGLVITDIASGSPTKPFAPRERGTYNPNSAGGLSVGAQSASWSKDGQKILVAYNSLSRSCAGIFTFDKDGGNATQLGYWMCSGFEESMPVIWAPDGSRVAVRYSGAQACVYISDISAVNTSGGRRKVNQCEYQDNPRYWSVDGKWIVVYFSGQQGGPGAGLFALDVEGNQRVPLSQLGAIKLYDQRYYPWKIVDKPSCPLPRAVDSVFPMQAYFWNCQ